MNFTKITQIREFRVREFVPSPRVFLHVSRRFERFASRGKQKKTVQSVLDSANERAVQREQ